jgi:biopolymer transport protein ExbB/TolQ
MVNKNTDEAPTDIVEARIGVQGRAFENELLRRSDLAQAANQAAQIAAQYFFEGIDAFKNAAETYKNVANALNDAGDPDAAKFALMIAGAIEKLMDDVPKADELQKIINDNK